MYTVHLINFGTFKDFNNFDEAKAFMIKACFESVMMLTGMQIARFSPIGGFWRDPAFW